MALTPIKLARKYISSVKNVRGILEIKQEWLYLQYVHRLQKEWSMKSIRLSLAPINILYKGHKKCVTLKIEAKISKTRGHVIYNNSW